MFRQNWKSLIHFSASADNHFDPHKYQKFVWKWSIYFGAWWIHHHFQRVWCTIPELWSPKLNKFGNFGNDLQIWWNSWSLVVKSKILKSRNIVKMKMTGIWKCFKYIPLALVFEEKCQFNRFRIQLLMGPFI